MVTQSSEFAGKTLSLKVLANAISKIENIRELEHTCEVLGVQITMRPLLPEQEVEVQEFVAPAWKDGRDQQASYAEFMDRLRHAALSYAIVQIDDLDMRDVEYISTGELDEHGNEVALPKVDALRSMLASTWTRPMLTTVFAQYGALLDKLDTRAGNAVTYDPLDLDTEIERLERRLVELRNTKEKNARPPENLLLRSQRAVLEAQSTRPQTPKRDAAADAQTLAEDVLASQAAPPQAAPPQAAPPQATPPQAAPTRRSAIPERAPAPSVSKPDEPTLAIDTEFSSAHAASTMELEVDHLGRTVPLGGDSFFDPSDPGAAVAMETRRQAQLIRESQERMRQQAERGAQRAEMGIPDQREAFRAQSRSTPAAAARHDPRTGGLRAAANTSNAVLDGGAGTVRSGRPGVRPTPVAPGVPAQLHGKPVYQTPTQVLDRPQRERAEPGAAPVTPVINPEGGSRNPNFRRPPT